MVDVVMPQMGVSVSEGTVTRWLRREGEQIAADEPLLEISTDKVDTEVPSPGDGVVQQILVQEGETVAVGTKLAVIAANGAAAPDAPAEAPAEAPAAPATPAAPPPAAAEPAPSAPAPSAPAAAPAAPAVPGAEDGHEEDRTFVSPVVARIAAEQGVDVSSVQGTGHGGRVTKKDILAFIQSGATAQPRGEPETAAAPAPAAGAQPAPAPAAPAPPAPSPEPQALGEQLEPMSAMRRGIAEHMRRSLDTAAHVTSAIEVDMSRVVEIRERLKKGYQATYGVNPTYLIFVARAATDTLLQYPWINGEIRGDQIVTRSWVNLGFAVELADGKGLIVPVVKHAEGLNLLGMARAVADVAERARSKKLLPDDVQGGTFTITNPGGYGTFHGTPIISQPQAGILGTYAVVKRPWVVEDEFGNDTIAIRPMMNLTLTYDHRLVDGALAGRFLRDVRERLQTWGESDY
jgi:2-oxoglutarate dehydrogenase E2 component (dihydrolipoamide succinyltransferase)